MTHLTYRYWCIHVGYWIALFLSIQSTASGFLSVTPSATRSSSSRVLVSSRGLGSIQSYKGYKQQQQQVEVGLQVGCPNIIQQSIDNPPFHTSLTKQLLKQLLKQNPNPDDTQHNTQNIYNNTTQNIYNNTTHNNTYNNTQYNLPYVVDLPPLLNSIGLNSVLNSGLNSGLSQNTTQNTTHNNNTIKIAYPPELLLDLCTRPSTPQIKYTQRKRSLRILLNAQNITKVTGRTYIQTVLQQSRLILTPTDLYHALNACLKQQDYDEAVECVFRACDVDPSVLTPPRLHQLASFADVVGPSPVLSLLNDLTALHPSLTPPTSVYNALIPHDPSVLGVLSVASNFSNAVLHR